MHFDPDDCFATGSASVDTTPVHKTSRRLRGLQPEFGRLSTPTRAAPSRVAMVSTASQTSMQAPPVVLHTPRTPRPFYGERFEDAEDWLDSFERVAAFNEWDEVRKLKHVYYALEENARTWFENNEASMKTWPEFRRKLLATYADSERKEQAELALPVRVQKPNESVAMFVEDMCWLFKRADPNMPEERKVRHLMRGVKEQLFAGLVRDPPATVADFTREATTMEHALEQRFRQYVRQTDPATSNCHSLSTSNCGTADLREIIRSIVREELQKLHVAGHQPNVDAISDVVRDEIRQAMQTCTSSQSTPAPYYEAAPPVIAYTDMPRPTAPTVRPIQPQPRPLFQRYSDAAPRTEPGHYARKATIWRTADNRPLCYHCGEAGHVLRHCPYRKMGLRGFSPDAPRPRYGERPHDIQEYLAAHLRSSPPAQRRESRSPSPRRFTSPRRPFSSGTTSGRTPSPNRGN